MFSRVSRRSGTRARQAAQILNDHPARVANEEIRILMSTVGDLIGRLDAVTDPEVTRLRKQTQAALAGARDAITDSGAEWRDHAAELAERGGAFVRERPWTSVGLAALCVLAVGLLAGRAVMSE